jgi:archaeosine synthase beta-subunit
VTAAPPAADHFLPLTARQVRALRPPKGEIDPWATPPWLLEEERVAGGGRAPVLTVFLGGSECPLTCVFCDLWRHTLDGPTPPAALPRQLAAALEAAGPELPASAHVKLYNASNFFDPQAVPPADEPELARLLAPIARVVVESHPRLVGRRCLAFAERLGGRLEVAIGVESVHPRSLAWSGKGVELADLERAAATLGAHAIGFRAFVLVGAPFVPAAEAAGWVERTVRFAVNAGAAHVSLIPVRGGNGALEVLTEAGEFRPPRLGELETALDRGLELAAGTAVVTADLWDLERFADCPVCFAARRERLARMNLTGEREPPVACSCST